MVQRLLAARSESESRLALFASWFVIFFQFSLFLVIGTLLYVEYHDASRPGPAILDRIYPEFIWHNLPVGVAGLITAAILAAAMSNLSAALNALASTTIMDFVKPLSSDRIPKPITCGLPGTRLSVGEQFSFWLDCWPSTIAEVFWKLDSPLLRCSMEDCWASSCWDYLRRSPEKTPP